METNTPRRPYKRTGRPLLNIADPRKRRREGAGREDLRRRLDHAPDARKGGNERWCWSCCTWFAVSSPIARAQSCDRCAELGDSYLVPPHARVKIKPEALVEFRRAQGWSQDQLGELWEASRGSISNFERGVYDPLSWMVRALARILELPLEDVLRQLGATNFRHEQWKVQPWEPIEYPS